MKGLFMYTFSKRGERKTGFAEATTLGEIEWLLSLTPYRCKDIKISSEPHYGGVGNDLCPYPVTAEVGRLRMCVGYSSFTNGRTNQTCERK